MLSEGNTGEAKVGEPEPDPAQSETLIMRENFVSRPFACVAR